MDMRSFPFRDQRTSMHRLSEKTTDISNCTSVMFMCYDTERDLKSEFHFTSKQTLELSQKCHIRPHNACHRTGVML